jgi:hypothetical protein
MQEPERSSACPYCREPISLAAVKCPHCQEFLRENATDGDTRLPVELISLVGKSLVPITILVLALVFKPSLETLLQRTDSAEFLGTSIAFSHTQSFQGDLTPYEIYYLIGSAGNYGTGPRTTLNYGHLKESGQNEVLVRLEAKGLVVLEIDSQGFSDSQGVIVTPTEKGRRFLVELGLKFDGEKFPGAP